MTENKLCFTFHDYRSYLKHRLEGRGQRAQLAKELHCQSAFVSRVLSGDVHFSPEHAVQISRFLGHSELEREYFHFLLLEARAGNSELRDYYRSKRDEARAKREIIAERIQVKKELSREDQMAYYSSWHYAAIHVLLTVPRFRDTAEITRHLQLPRGRVQAILDFLVQTGLATLEGGKYGAGETRIHLGRESPMIARHHSNWRMRAMQAMDNLAPTDLFFSGPISIAESDVEKIRAKLLKLLEEVEPIFQSTKEECVYCLGLDFFRV